jgi:TRAP-type uncharacterized transport system fused permease subunit
MKPNTETNGSEIKKSIFRRIALPCVLFLSTIFFYLLFCILFESIKNQEIFAIFIALFMVLVFFLYREVKKLSGALERDILKSVGDLVEMIDYIIDKVKHPFLSFLTKHQRSSGSWS